MHEAVLLRITRLSAIFCNHQLQAHNAIKAFRVNNHEYEVNKLIRLQQHFTTQEPHPSQEALGGVVRVFREKILFLGYTRNYNLL